MSADQPLTEGRVREIFREELAREKAAEQLRLEEARQQAMKESPQRVEAMLNTLAGGLFLESKTA